MSSKHVVPKVGNQNLNMSTPTDFFFIYISILNSWFILAGFFCLQLKLNDRYYISYNNTRVLSCADIINIQVITCKSVQVPRIEEVQNTKTRYFRSEKQAKSISLVLSSEVVSFSMSSYCNPTQLSHKIIFCIFLNVMYNK